MRLGSRIHVTGGSLMVPAIPIHGFVAPSFEPVREAFARNFAERGELGAACAVYWRGEPVVDLWAGKRDEATGAPWEERTIVPVFSTSKGVSALTMAYAHSHGLLDYDEKVAAYWPEFAQNGKANVTVRQLLAHQAGLAGVDEPLTEALLADPDRLGDVLARQRPAWEPGTRHGYHTWTLGFYQSQIIRRVDPKGRTLGRFFQEEIAEPLGLDFYIGLPETIPSSQVARLKTMSQLSAFLRLEKPFSVMAAMLNRRSHTYQAFMNTPVMTRHTNVNRREVVALEIPSGAGVGNARALAKLYGQFAAGGRQLRLKPETLAELSQPATPPTLGPFDETFQVSRAAFHLGFEKPLPCAIYGRSDQEFGHRGAGGSAGFADPVQQIGYGYTMNRLAPYFHNDPRDIALRDAVYSSLHTMAAPGAAHKPAPFRMSPITVTPSDG